MNIIEKLKLIMQLRVMKWHTGVHSKLDNKIHTLIEVDPIVENSGEWEYEKHNEQVRIMIELMIEWGLMDATPPTDYHNQSIKDLFACDYIYSIVTTPTDDLVRQVKLTMVKDKFFSGVGEVAKIKYRKKVEVYTSLAPFTKHWNSTKVLYPGTYEIETTIYPGYAWVKNGGYYITTEVLKYSESIDIDGKEVKTKTIVSPKYKDPKPARITWTPAEKESKLLSFKGSELIQRHKHSSNRISDEGKRHKLIELKLARRSALNKGFDYELNGQMIRVDNQIQKALVQAYERYGSEVPMEVVIGCGDSSLMMGRQDFRYLLQAFETFKARIQTKLWVHERQLVHANTVEEVREIRWSD